ncbi:MAG: hypothetical protein KGL62_08595 [Bradyrhizobium sp.]|uniref:hypothetical protein n=1 Tax=Bradyrhizobium sp. TaxID=376 RepID=UPI00239A0785|nr:hypothetical protein [Bradyrhizobium sp.]MDE2602410.1 hypothetical protein [Bradyrhizobium sp.]
MADIQHVGSNDPNNGKFDHFAQVIQDIRELREKHASRPSPDRRARSTKANVPTDESLPLFLSPPDNQNPQPTDRDAKHQDADRQDSLHQDAPSQDSPDQASMRLDTLRQDTLHQPPVLQDVPRQNIWHQDDWQQAALEADRERMDAVVPSTITKSTVKKGIVAISVLSAVAALFTLGNHRTLITDARASLAAVLPTMSSSRGSSAPLPENIATTGSVPVTALAVAPTREAIAAAYQTALQSLPQPSAEPAAAPDRANSGEFAALLKQAHDGDVLLKQFQAWDAAQNAKARPAQ